MSMVKVKRSNPLKRVSVYDKVFYLISTLILLLFMLIVLLPLLNIVASSFSGSYAVLRGEVYLLPKKPTLEGYTAVFRYPSIWRAYGMTFFYTFAGTLINLIVTMICAYPLAQKQLPYKGIIMGLMTFTMFFGGGLIPSYILNMKLKLLNTVWVMLIPGAMSVYNMILARTFIQGIPEDLWEASQLDGCNEFTYFRVVVVPLSSTLMSVLALFYAVGHWNSYFDAMIYLNDKNLYPLQLILRDILVVNTMDMSAVEGMADYNDLEAREALARIMKYSLIMVSSVPVLILYPFVKKYFAKGVMLGSLKG